MRALVGATLLAAASFASFAQSTATTGGMGAAPGSTLSGAPIGNTGTYGTTPGTGIGGAPTGNAGTFGTTPSNTGVGAPTGTSSTFGTPLPGTGAANTPARTTFDNVLNSGSSTGSSAASGATQATTCRPGAIVCSAGD
jgi:hypothetical protein